MAKFVNILPSALKARLNECGRLQSARANERLLFQGEPANYIGFILSGRAKAVAYSEHGIETWLGRFEAGEFFGHISFLTQSPVRFEVSAVGPMQLRLIPITEIQTLLDETDEYGAMMNSVFTRDLARRLDDMMARLVEALTLSAKGRVCAELLRLSSPIGITPDMSVIRPNPVFVDMALRLNASRETVSRAISELQKQGVIKREAGAIIITQPDALRRAVK